MLLVGLVYVLKVLLGQHTECTEPLYGGQPLEGGGEGEENINNNKLGKSRIFTELYKILEDQDGWHAAPQLTG